MKIGKTFYTKQSTSKLTAAKPKNTNYSDDLLERSKDFAGLGIKPDESYSKIIARQVADLGNPSASDISGLY